MLFHVLAESAFATDEKTEKLSAIRRAVRDRDELMRTLRLSYSMSYVPQNPDPKKPGGASLGPYDCEWIMSRDKCYFRSHERGREIEIAFDGVRSGRLQHATAGRPARLLITPEAHPELFGTLRPIHATGHRIYNTQLTLTEALNRETVRIAGAETIDRKVCQRIDIGNVPAIIRRPGTIPQPLRVSAFFEEKNHYRLKRILVVYDAESPGFAEAVRKAPLLAEARFDVRVDEFGDAAALDGRIVPDFPMDIAFSQLSGTTRLQVKTVEINVELPNSTFEITPPEGTQVQEP